MFRMGPVLARDNNHGVSGAEPERIAKYQDLLYAQTGIRFHRSHRNKHKACACRARINRRSMGASTPHGIPSDRQVISQVCGHADTI